MNPPRKKAGPHDEPTDWVEARRRWAEFDHGLHRRWKIATVCIFLFLLAVVLWRMVSGG